MHQVVYSQVFCCERVAKEMFWQPARKLQKVTAMCRCCNRSLKKRLEVELPLKLYLTRRVDL